MKNNPPLAFWKDWGFFFHLHQLLFAACFVKNYRTFSCNKNYSITSPIFVLNWLNSAVVPAPTTGRPGYFTWRVLEIFNIFNWKEKFTKHLCNLVECKSGQNCLKLRKLVGRRMPQILYVDIEDQHPELREVCGVWCCMVWGQACRQGGLDNLSMITTRLIYCCREESKPATFSGEYSRDKN